MADKVRLGKIRGKETWIADYKCPESGKRRQRAVASESAGWQMIHNAHAEFEASKTRTRKKQEKSGIKQGPKIHTGGFTLIEAFQLSWDVRFSHQRQTQNVYSHWRKIRPFFGPNTQLAAITAPWLNLFRKELAKTLEPPSINRVVSVLRAMRSDAIEHGKVEDLPTWGKQLPEEKITPRWLTVQEIEALLEYFRRRAARAQAAHAGESNELWSEMVDVVRFRLNQGSRFEETRRVCPKDIHWRAGDLTFWKTKNGKPRTVKIIGISEEILRRRSKGKMPDEPIFTISYYTFRKHWKEAKEALGLQGRVVGHTLRHTFAYRAVSSNINTSIIKQAGGWESLTALDHYDHVDTQAMVGLKEALECFEK